MALLFWITGNDGLHNQALSDIDWNPNHEILEGGKTGSCIRFNSTENTWTNALTLPKAISSFTVSFWHKMPGSTNSVGLLNIKPSAGTSVTLSQQESSFSLSKFPSSNPDTWSDVYGTWKHIVYSYDNATQTHKIIVHGFEAYKEIGAIDPITEVMFGAGDFCDIRIYDEAISLRQIRDMASALIAYYPLGNPTNNNRFGLTDSSGFGHNANPGVANHLLSWSDKAVVGYGSFSPNNTNFLNCGHITFSSSSISMSIWVYFDSWSSLGSETYGLVTLSGTNTGLTITNGELKASLEVDEGSTKRTYQDSYDVTGLKKGWHMFSANLCLFEDDSIQVSLLVDGKYANTVNEDNEGNASLYNPDTASLYIGATSSGVPMPKGFLANCRVYANSFYGYGKIFQNKIEIDNKGNLYGYGLGESATGETSMSNTGIIGGQIVEGETTIKAFANTLKCKEYHDI